MCPEFLQLTVDDETYRDYFMESARVLDFHTSC